MGQDVPAGIGRIDATHLRQIGLPAANVVHKIERRTQDLVLLRWSFLLTVAVLVGDKIIRFVGFSSSLLPQNPCPLPSFVQPGGNVAVWIDSSRGSLHRFGHFLRLLVCLDNRGALPPKMEPQSTQH